MIFETKKHFKTFFFSIEIWFLNLVVHGCAREKKPGVYTHIPSYTDWIEQTIDQLGLASIEKPCEKNEIEPEITTISTVDDISFSSSFSSIQSTTTSFQPNCSCNCQYKFAEHANLENLIITTPGYDSHMLTPITCMYEFLSESSSKKSVIKLKTECDLPTNRKCQKTGTYLQTYRNYEGKKKRHYSCDNSRQVYHANSFKSKFTSKYQNYGKKGCKMSATYGWFCEN